MKQMLRRIINLIDSKVLKGNFPKMYISDAEMESNMQRFISIGEERDIEPFCTPNKGLYKMIKVMLEKR